ncbi:MAG: PKD domain-containing protein, partial [Halobacteria archaeon]|nr:PKD domain-containing protein [Halobacteria archaeon]
ANPDQTDSDNDGKGDACDSEDDTNEPPSAKFDYSPSDPKVNETVTFDASPSQDPDGSIESYEWDFDNDGKFDETNQSISSVFESPGTYEVTLRVTDEYGNSDTVTKTITVEDTEDSDSTGTGPLGIFIFLV